jgi:phospholipid/cholesterol/gamma-HCH transport system substrate-binding protein
VNSWLRGRNPVTYGLIFGLVGALVVAAAIVVPELMLVARTRDYQAQFANASGLRPDDAVYVAGVPSGKVTGVELAGDKVVVEFRLDSDRPLGAATTASIKLATILGRRYLAVEPAGRGELAAGGTIPIDRTSVPYILDDLGRQATETTGELDLDQLRTALNTVAETMPKDSGLVTSALDGVTAAATLVNDHSGQITQLLDGAQTLTTALLDQRDTITALLGDANTVATALAQRRTVIQQLLADLASLTELAQGFLDRNSAEVESVLTALHGLTDTLATNEQALGQVIERLGPVSSYYANVTGNGNWVDIAGPAGPLPDNLLCAAGLLQGCA